MELKWYELILSTTDRVSLLRGCAKIWKHKGPTF